jgi:hypothetical protein
MVPRLTTFTTTGRSTAHTRCRNEVKDLECSVKLCGRAVVDNEYGGEPQLDPGWIRNATSWRKFPGSFVPNLEDLLIEGYARHSNDRRFTKS